VRVAVVVGNPKPRSRTLGVAQATAAAVTAALGAADATTETTVIDLADYASRLFDWDDRDLAELGAAVAAADLAIFASPTYKATYTGLLKAFLDRYQNNGLDGVVAIPVMVGAGAVHALAPEVHLRPVLVELGATVPSRALFVLESQIDDIDAVTKAWAATAASVLGRALGRP